MTLQRRESASATPISPGDASTDFSDVRDSAALSDRPLSLGHNSSDPFTRLGDPSVAYKTQGHRMLPVTSQATASFNHPIYTPAAEQTDSFMSERVPPGRQAHGTVDWDALPGPGDLSRGNTTEGYGTLPVIPPGMASSNNTIYTPSALQSDSFPTMNVLPQQQAQYTFDSEPFSALGNGSMGHTTEDYEMLPVTSPATGSHNTDISTSGAQQNHFLTVPPHQMVYNGLQSHAFIGVGDSSGAPTIEGYGTVPGAIQATAPFRTISNPVSPQNASHTSELGGPWQQAGGQSHRRAGAGVAQRPRTLPSGHRLCMLMNPDTGRPCDREFSRLRALQMHESKVHGRPFPKVQTTVVWSCPVCGDTEQSGRGGKYLAHHRKFHPELPPPGK